MITVTSYNRLTHFHIITMKNTDKKPVVEPVRSPQNPKETSGDKNFDKAIDKLFPKKIHVSNK